MLWSAWISCLGLKQITLNSTVCQHKGLNKMNFLLWISYTCDFYWWFIMTQCPEGRVTGNLWPCGQYSFLVEFFQVQSLLLQLSVLEYHQLSTASADIFQLSGREWQHAETSNIWRKFHELPSTNRSISHRDMQIWIDLNTRANILVLQYK